MEATYSSETSVDFQRITLRYIPEDRTGSVFAFEYKCKKIKISDFSLGWSLSQHNAQLFSVG
jgi:hypothetical protein